MAKRDFIKRHLLIIETLRKSPCAFSELIKVLQDNEEVLGYAMDISQRTFQRDCKEILTIWGVEIVYNKRSLAYEIVNLDDDFLLDRTLQSFDLISVLNKGKTISKYIFLEQRRANGIEYFDRVIYAIDNKLELRFLHSSYWKEPSNRRCMPKAIKESQNRFYLIAFDLDKQEFRNFGLDRVSQLVVIDMPHNTPDIDVAEYYKNSFGIECYEKAVKVLLHFDIEQKQYITSLPLHSSQKIVKEDSHAFVLELFIHPTNEFILEVMKYGSICEVLEPMELRETVRNRVKAMYEMYLRE